MEKYQEGIKEATEAIMTDASCVNAYKVRGECYAYLGKRTEAIRDYNTCLDINPVEFEVVRNKAALHSGVEVFTIWDKYLSLETENPEAFKERAKCYTEINNYEEAIADYNECLNIAPKDVEALLSRARCYVMLEYFEEALQDYTEVLKINPSDPYLALTSRGLCFEKLGDIQAAIRDFDQALKVKPDKELQEHVAGSKLLL
jgi:tetratricopeptide (TPR) repeat protein